MERKTPLYQTHVDAGGKIVEFGGFLMPVQYPTGVLAEHMAVRQKADSLTRVAQGRARCLKGHRTRSQTGRSSSLRTSPPCRMAISRVFHVLQRRGRALVDDFIVYRCAADDHWLSVNVGNRDKRRAAGSRAI